MRDRRFQRTAVGACAAAALLLASCSSGGDGTGGDGSGGGECEPAPEGEQVTLTFSSWIPNFQETVDLWNSQNPDIQVEYTEVTAGNSGTYQNYLNQVEAGNTDDLGFIDYDVLPTFRIQDGLRNFYACAGVAQAQGEFIESVWNLTSLGEPETVYGLGLDFGPETLFYRADLFDEAGIAVPTTWEEFYEAAKQIRATGGYIANFASAPTYWPPFWMQAGQDWFSLEDDVWSVNIDTEETRQTADFIQRFIDEDLVTTYPLFQDEYSKVINDGTVWTQIGGPWATALIEVSAADTAGLWAAAKAPVWDGMNEVGTWGGASMAMFKNTQYPYEAAQFAIWATTHPDALALNSIRGGLYPPINDVVSKVPEMQEGLPFFMDQAVFADIEGWTNDVSSTWIWGPTMVQVNADIDAEFATALAGNQTFAQALETIQSKTVEAMTTQGLSVAE
ncbi:MAG: extracellular solute-binding protein [Beutenbergiaceae bacterium]